MACSHAAYVAAYEQLSSLADVERLARDPGCPLSFEALTSVLGQKQLALTKRTDGQHREQAAATLGISLKTLYNRLRSYGAA